MGIHACMNTQVVNEEPTFLHHLSTEWSLTRFLREFECSNMF